MIGTPISREALLHVVKTLPVAARTLAQLGRLFRDAECDGADVRKLLQRDAALSDRMLRISNTSLFNTTGHPFPDLEKALEHVRAAEVYRLTGFAVAAELPQHDLAFYGFTRTELRENSLLTALIMEALVDTAKHDPFSAYTAGLLRSTGKIVLDHVARGVFQGGSYETQGLGSLADWEMAYLGVTNCDVAAAVLQQWRFPAETIAAIRDHYLSGANVASPLATLLNVAVAAVERCGFGLAGEAYYFNTAREKYSSVRVTEASVNEAVVHALNTFNLIRDAVA